MSDHLGKDVGDFFKAGVGALASAVEKGKSFVDELTTEGTETNKKVSQTMQDLTKKGEEALGQAKEFGSQLTNKVKDAVSSQIVDVEAFKAALKGFSRDQLMAVRDEIDRYLQKLDENQDEPQDPQAPQDPPADEQKPE